MCATSSTARKPAAARNESFDSLTQR
jgi:hypothetical protein